MWDERKWKVCASFVNDYITLELEEKITLCSKGEPKRELRIGFTAAFEKISNGLAFDVDLNQKNIVEKWTREKKVLLKAIKKKFVEESFFFILCEKKSKENWEKY